MPFYSKLFHVLFISLTLPSVALAASSSADTSSTAISGTNASTEAVSVPPVHHKTANIAPTTSGGGAGPAVGKNSDPDNSITLAPDGTSTTAGEPKTKPNP